MRLRQSQLKIWSQCSLQAHLNETHPETAQLAGSKQIFGTVIHYCLDQYHRGMKIEDVVELFKELWNDPERITVKIDVWNKFTSYGTLREKGIDILRGYHQKNRWEDRTILASEHRFLVPFGTEHELEGIVDFLQVKKDGKGRKTLQICDLKTNSKAPTQVELRLNIQFSVYAFASTQPEFWIGNGPNFPGVTDGAAWFEELKKAPRRGVWFHLMTGRELDAGERDEDDHMRLYRLVTEIEKAQQAQVFVPNIGDACTYCAFTEHCNITIPNRDELALELL
jgi:CRISPR/Cas system-associated exonuclease Cas4 (RecB family)